MINFLKSLFKKRKLTWPTKINWSKTKPDLSSPPTHCFWYGQEDNIPKYWGKMTDAEVSKAGLPPANLFKKKEQG